MSKLEARVAELQQVTGEVKTLRSSSQRDGEQNDALRATIMDKDLCLEGALADADRFKAQVLEKDKQVGWGFVYGWNREGLYR